MLFILAKLPCKLYSLPHYVKKDTYRGINPKPKNETVGRLKAASWKWFSGGKKVSEVCREMGVSLQAFYKWKRRYGGSGVNKVRELRQLREENRKLKGIVADLTLDEHILQEVLSKKG
jgi:putative transposase